MHQSAAHRAYGLFFPAAAIYGALVPLLSLAAMDSLSWGPDALATRSGHAHEMVLGFASAVIAGYLLGPLPVRRLRALFTLWVAARLAYLLAPAHPGVWLLNAVFPVLLAVHVAPKFHSAAKKLRNKAFAPVLASICLSMAVFAWLVDGRPSHRTLPAAVETVLLLAFLMTLMGGRVIAPAAAGQLSRQGIKLAARVQPRLEGALVVLLTAVVLLFPLPHGAELAAPFAGIAGAILLVRLWRWHLWTCRARPDLWCLGIGSGWLGAGLIFLAGSLFADRYLMAAVHAVMVGGLGSLSLGIMGRTRLQRAKLDPARSVSLLLGTALINVAAIARGAAGLGIGSRDPALWTAALCWAAGLLLLAARLVQVEFRKIPAAAPKTGVTPLHTHPRES